MAQTGYTPLQIYSSSTASAAPAAANLNNSTLGSELAINITDGKLFYKDNGGSVQVIGWKTVPTSAGGTGLTSYTAGDMLYYATGTTLSKLAIGASGRYLSSSGTAPQWSAPAALTKTDDTNVTLTLGGSASTALLNAASLTLGWTGTLAVGRGGTGLSSLTANGILYASSTSAVATGSALTFDGTNFATTGTASATRFIPTGSTVATNGMYLPTTNSVAISTNSTNAIYADASQRVGVNATPLASSTQTSHFQIGDKTIFNNSSSSNYSIWRYNSYYDGSNDKYIQSTAASVIQLNNGVIQTYTAATGTAGNNITFTTGPYVANLGTSWTNSSDERLKDIIEPITNAVEKIKQLRTVIGKFKIDPVEKRRSFLIAQDVLSVLPEAVDQTNPESLGVQYTDVIPLLIAAIKEQQNEIDFLKSIINNNKVV